METVIDLVLRNLVASRSDIFISGSIYSHFEQENTRDGDLGFQSNVIFGRIVYENDGKTCRSEPLVLKTSPESSLFGHPKYCQRFVFINEISFFVNFVPLFDSLKPCTLFPILYNSLIESNDDHSRAVLVFQNVQALNYVPCERKSFLDLNHLRLMVRKLGEFHAYSFKSRHEDENRFLMMAKSMFNTQVDSLSRNERMLVNLGERAMVPLSEDPKYKKKVNAAREKLARLDENVFDVLEGTAKDEQDILVLCHGDYLCSNVLFRYSDKNDKLPIDMKMLDMASCRLASPVVDLALVLYMHTTQTMRDLYWDQLIDDYYTALKTTFPQTEVPSLQQIWREFQLRAFHVFFIAGFFLSSLIARDDNLPQIFDSWPEEYQNYEYAKIPPEVRCKAYFGLGGPKTTDALIDMLKDMIDRGLV